MEPFWGLQAGTACGRHRLLWALQKKPVSEVQSTALQPHTPGFSVTPNPSMHAGAWLQVLEVALHAMPVLEVHRVGPQTQVGEEVCGLEPSWGSQARAVCGAHRQDQP